MDDPGANAGREMLQWYYGENGQQQGPVDDAGLNALISQGLISPATLLWREGLPSWQTLEQLRASGSLYVYATPQQMQMQGYNMVVPATSGLAIASMICGILGLITCMVPLGIPAVICGHMAMSRIAKSPMQMTGRGMALAGLVCGYLALLIFSGFIGNIIFAVATHR